MKMSRVVMLAACALSLGGSSKDGAREGPAPQKHQFVVELDPKADVKLGTTDGVRTVEDFSAADKRYAVYEADSADALAKHLEHARLSPKKVTEVKDINSPTRGGGKPAGDQPRKGQKTFVIDRRIHHGTYSAQRSRPLRLTDFVRARILIRFSERDGGAAICGCPG